MSCVGIIIGSKQTRSAGPTRGDDTPPCSASTASVDYTPFDRTSCHVTSRTEGARDKGDGSGVRCRVTADRSFVLIPSPRPRRPFYIGFVFYRAHVSAAAAVTRRMAGDTALRPGRSSINATEVGTTTTRPAGRARIIFGYTRRAVSYVPGHQMTRGPAVRLRTRVSRGARERAGEEKPKNLADTPRLVLNGLKVFRAILHGSVTYEGKNAISSPAVIMIFYACYLFFIYLFHYRCYFFSSLCEKFGGIDTHDTLLLAPVVVVV